jgi:hypothetical protein
MISGIYFRLGTGLKQMLKFIVGDVDIAVIILDASYLADKSPPMKNGSALNLNTAMAFICCWR